MTMTGQMRSTLPTSMPGSSAGAVGSSQRVDALAQLRRLGDHHRL